MVVYCYDLTAGRSRFTSKMDAFLRAEWFQGLAMGQLADAFARRFRHDMRGWSRSPHVMERVIANRLSELGLRNRMTGEAK